MLRQQLVDAHQELVGVLETAPLVEPGQSRPPKRHLEASKPSETGVLPPKMTVSSSCLGRQTTSGRPNRSMGHACRH